MANLTLAITPTSRTLDLDAAILSAGAIYPIRYTLDNEVVWVTGGGGTASVSVVRGADNSVAVAHVSGTPLVASPAGGSGLVYSRVGKDAIGASTEAAVLGSQSYFKAFTPTKSGLLIGVAVYCKQTASDAASGVTFGVNADNAGAPGAVLGHSGAWYNFIFEKSNAGLSDAGWFGLPVAVPVVAGTQYWLQVLFSTSSPMAVYYDAGTDQININGGANAIADGRRYALTITAKSYSIRGDLLS